MSDEAKMAITIDYTNHRGERGRRRITPLTLTFGSNQYHPEMQWILRAFDEDKQVLRTFAMKNVHSWE